MLRAGCADVEYSAPSKSGNYFSSIPTALNPLRNINAVLGKPGIGSSSVGGHQNHLHVYIERSALQSLSSDLSAQPQRADQPAANSAVVAQDFLNAFSELIEGETLMFAMDIPAVLLESTPVVLAQAAKPSAAPPFNYILTGCEETQPTPEDPRSALRVIWPAAMLSGYYVEHGRAVDASEIQTKPLQYPQHGSLTPQFDQGSYFYRYDPTPGFLGDDQATFEATYKGARYKIILDIKVLSTVNERSPICPKPRLIGVKPAAGNKPVSDASQLDLNGVVVSFADLPGSALGASRDSAITPARAYRHAHFSDHPFRDGLHNWHAPLHELIQ